MYTFENGVLRIWTWYSDASGDPTVLQPFDPRTNEAWESEEVASTYADEWLALPGNQPPVIEEDTAEEAVAEEATVEEVSPTEGTSEITAETAE